LTANVCLWTQPDSFDSTSKTSESSHSLAHSEAGPNPTSHAAPSSLPKARILAVEDDPFIREGLIRLINRQPDLLCCGHADSIAATPQAIASQSPDLVLMDLRLKDGESLELISALKLGSQDCGSGFLTRGRTRLCREALQAGARGYVMKQEAVEEILAAIRAVLLGRIHVSRDMAGRLLPKLFPASSPH